MITVPEATQIIIKRSRYLSEAISKDIINHSSLARYIKPEIEEMLIKKVSLSSIIMALKRLQKELKPHSSYKNIFKSAPTMLLRSNLVELNIGNSESLKNKYEKILSLNDSNRYLLLLSKNANETTIIISNNLYVDTKNILKEETIISEFKNLSSISTQLPKDAIKSPGVFYFFLKSLAWEGINILEIISSYSEFTLIFEDKEVNKAFSILKSLFSL